MQSEAFITLVMVWLRGLEFVDKLLACYTKFVLASAECTETFPLCTLGGVLYSCAGLTANVS